MRLHLRVTNRCARRRRLRISTRIAVLDLSGARMMIRVLGPIEISDDAGNHLAVAGAAQRRLLAMLMIHRGSVVRAERLAEVSGVSLGALRVTVSRFRKLVGDALVVTAADGYVLHADAVDVDSARFETLLGHSQLADDDRKVALLDDALGEWRGPAYAEFADEEWARPAAVRLNELRAAAVEDRFAALLGVGRFTDASAGLETHTAEFPLRDRARGLLMRALAAQGRQAEALRAYQSYHRYLGEEIGTEPSHELRDLERRIATGWHDATPTPTGRIGSPRSSGDTRRSNLSTPATRFIGRSGEVETVVGLALVNRLITLTGVGGVGKTRLAIQVAAELVPQFPDGIWFVELAPVGDPAAIPDAVATTMGVIAQPGLTVTASLAQALAGRHLLIVLDNCEHVIDAAADLVEAILARTNTVKIIATSREGLRIGAEHLWSVPSLDTGGVNSAAAELFMERARAVAAGFSVNTDTDATAVTEICTRLDGNALAIELAAARMVSMSPTDVRDRLGDRFRLLTGGRRGLERHQTLRHAVQWSYELLTDDERFVLQHASVFADGFNLAAITDVCGSFDEYVMLDLVDSLVRKSLVTAHQLPGGRARYGLLETIRQFAEDQLRTTGTIGEVRDRHARHYAAQAIAYWDMWDGPGFDTATDWVEVEFANLRAGFRWAIDRSDLDTATAIAAHTAMLIIGLQQFEPFQWAEALLPAAIAADVRQLPRLYVAASHCIYVGRPEDAVGYAQAASALQDNPGYQPFDPAWAPSREAHAHFVAGRPDRYVEINAALATRPGLARVMGLRGQVLGLATVRRSGEAMAIAEDALNAARAHANPYWIASAYSVCGVAFTKTDPARALDSYRGGLAYTRQHRLPQVEALIAKHAALLEAVHGDLDQALTLFTTAINSFHQAGNPVELTSTFANLAVFFRITRPEIAATLQGTTTHFPPRNSIILFAAVIDHVRNTLGTETFDRCVATGAAMDTAEAVRYAHAQIEAARSEHHGAVEVPRQPASANSPSERKLRLVKGASAQR